MDSLLDTHDAFKQGAWVETGLPPALFSLSAWALTQFFGLPGGEEQALDFLRSEVSGGLNGFQLRVDRTSTTVPEPGSLGLAGLALAGLLLRRRGQA